ncbi:MAG: methylenetetrahydrofolate reductase [Buchnera aphidicola (Acyrthosiphon caraganae)]|nr:MAG: methylenetetrahydrofolate reductase [Buchnera aphidicola (Acyrthosiphon caraganae)]
MRIFSEYHKDIVNQKLENVRNNIQCSFEFFPPKSSSLEENLWISVKHLTRLRPKFFSVTYGANSGEREKTYDIVKKIYEKTGVITAAHLTCVNSTSDELKKIAQNYWKNGIKSIVALRGDTLNKNYKHTMYALDLVVLLKKVADFDISVAAYPECHPESKNSKLDILNLKKKIDAGANRAITQFFFNIESYLRFRENCIKNRINVEIIPGILPVCNFSQLQRFSNMTNVQIPKWMFEMFHGLDHDIFTQKIVGSSIAIDMVNKLSCEGVKNFHFYTLNQSDITYSVCHILGL